MNDAWPTAIGPFAVAALALLVPGVFVVLAGWGARRLVLYFFTPALSLAILAVSAIVAPLVGLSWSFLPVGLVTVLAAAVAWLLRRWVDGSARLQRPPAATVIVAILSATAAAAVLLAQLAYVFGSPDNISQTFDAIVHLNSAAYAVDTANASAFHIGDTSDISFYPNGWHVLASLTALTTGAPVPVAVTASNMAIGAIAWPLSCMALSSVLIGVRKAVLVGSAALSTAFGAFPLLLMHFGVLYPNAVAYAVLPAGIAAVWMLCRPEHARDRWRSLVLLLVVCSGLGLSHPNAFLALFVFGTALALFELVRVAATLRERRTWITNASVGIALLAAGAVLWRVSRTNWEMSRWGQWQSTAQALGEGIFLTPRGFSLSIATATLIAAGIVAIIRRPRLTSVGVPFAAAVFMFVLVSGTPVENLLREMVTNPWYNDSYRLAALLPVAGIPVAVLGAVALWDRAWNLATLLHMPRVVVRTVAVVLGCAVFAIGANANVRSTAETARGSYALTNSAALVTSDEMALLKRLSDTVPTGSLILGNPWTGASLAYAIGGRDVVETHVFGERTTAEAYVDAHLDEITEDSEVCAAIDEIGADYVLDFGTENVFNDPGRDTTHDGYAALAPSDRLSLIDNEGDARLFRIEGC